MLWQFYPPKQGLLSRSHLDDRKPTDDRLLFRNWAVGDGTVGRDNARLLALDTATEDPDPQQPWLLGRRREPIRPTAGKSSSEMWSIEPSSNEIKYLGIELLLLSGGRCRPARPPSCYKRTTPDPGHALADESSPNPLSKCRVACRCRPVTSNVTPREEKRCRTTKP